MAQVLDEAGLCRLLLPSPEKMKALFRASKRVHTFWDHLVQIAHRGNKTIDLSGADLHGSNLFGAKLRPITLTGADLRKVSAHYTTFSALEWVNFDGADLTNAYFENAEECSFRKAILHEGWFCFGHGDTYRRCDFTGATMTQLQADEGHFPDCTFEKADLTDASLEYSDLSKTSLTRANLTRAHCAKSKFEGANLTGAILYRADFRDASLVNADLRKADLREAVLSGADLTGALVEGANFAGAVLDKARVTGVDFSRARNYQPPVTRSAGPKLKELAQAAAGSKSFETYAEVDLGKGEHAKLSLYARGTGSRILLTARSDYRRDDNEATNLLDAPTIEQGMLNLALRWPQGRLRLDTVQVSGSRTVRGAKLKSLALAAWAEAFGLEATAPEALEQQKAAQQAELKKLRETMLKELRGGTAGVKKWNAHSNHERAQIGPLNGLDLKGLRLAGVELSPCDLRESNFEAANLQKAPLGSCQLQAANFTRADLNGAFLSSIHASGASFEKAPMAGCALILADLNNANLRGTDLTGSVLRSAYLLGADFTGAQLDGVEFERAIYDDATRFPRGFVPPETMVYDEPPPAAPTPTAPGSLNFAAFFERLGHQVDPGRLANATAMLKAERFQLFADVQSDTLLGIVRSQSSEDLLYSCRLTADGSFSCCTQNLRACGGMRGALCKHLLVLIVGLAKSGKLDPATVDAWVIASRAKKPVLDSDVMSETFLRYKGAEAGEIDWRPTETIPEDYYAL